MRVTLTAADLTAFEEQIARDFAEKRIHAPIHLSSGNEQSLINIFSDYVDEDDWICCSWRSHLHCLLKGVPPRELRDEILAGHSIALNFPDKRILSSAIVGGTAPIAVGLALGIKMRGEPHKVVAFLGDMTARTGIVHESKEYARNHGLPILWVVEDNGKSVCTDTAEVWGGASRGVPRTIHYQYASKWPHCGLDRWVQF